MQIKLLVEGGEMKPGPTLSQKLGPAGINVSQVITKVNDATKAFKGMKVPVELNIELNTKAIEVKIFSPPVAELLKRELGIEKGSGLQKKQYVGNASIEQIISIAKTKSPNLLCNDLKSAVKTVIGTCVSLGVLVEDNPAAELGHQIDGGKFGKEIREESTETPPEKKAKLKEYLEKVQKEQEELAKKEAAAKEAAEATKVEPGKIEGPAEAEKPETKAEAVEEKPKEEKKEAKKEGKKKT